jgi:hypothetical protein
VRFDHGLVAKRVTDNCILKRIRGVLLMDSLVRPMERMKRGHHFVRHAYDCNIYVCSQRAGERVATNIELFLTKHLKLTINEAKSTAARRCGNSSASVSQEGQTPSGALRYKR